MGLTPTQYAQQDTATLTQAFAALGIPAPVGDTFDYVMGQAWGEIPPEVRASTDWGPSHNWGCVTMYNSAWGSLTHTDHDKNGKAYTSHFQVYPTELDGAEGMLRTVLRAPGIRAGFLGQTPMTVKDYAAALYANNYYTGTQGTKDQRITAYAKMIANNANRYRKLIGMPPLGSNLLGLGAAETGIGWGTWAMGAVLGAGALWYKKGGRL